MGPTVFWLVVAICSIVVDVMTSSFFFVLFSIGAVVAAICAALGVPFIIQVIIFAVVSIISLILGYPVLKKKYKNMQKRTPLREETYIGKNMISEKEIFDKAQIKINGEYWTVVNEGEVIHVGDKFEITGIEGIKLKIKKS
jgi:membrane protein implicated in regulation of membrane protease activity